MTIIELKNQLNNNVADFKSLIFTYKDNDFVINEYIKKIAQIKNLKIKYVSEDYLKNLDSASEMLFETAEDKFLLIYKVDKLSYSNFKFNYIVDDLIIVCKSIDKDMIEYDTLKDMSVEMPELNEWRIKDYMKLHCSGLTTDAIDWLYKVTNGDIYRISNELFKLELYNKQEQDEMFLELNKDSNYSDMCDLNIYNLTNTITRKDYLGLINCLSEIENIDVEPVGLITILHKALKDIINIQLNAKATPESLGMNVKKFKAIEYSCGKYSNEKLIEMFKFINDFDYKLKSGKLDLSKNKLIDYIICGMMS